MRGKFESRRYSKGSLCLYVSFLKTPRNRSKEKKRVEELSAFKRQGDRCARRMLSHGKRSVTDYSKRIRLHPADDN